MLADAGRKAPQSIGSFGYVKPWRGSGIGALHEELTASNASYMTTRRRQYNVSPNSFKIEILWWNNDIPDRAQGKVGKTESRREAILGLITGYAVLGRDNSKGRSGYPPITVINDEWNDDLARLFEHQPKQDKKKRENRMIIAHDNVEPSGLAFILIAAGTPMLPLPHLSASPLLPHGSRMLETFGFAAIKLQGEIPFGTCKENGW